MFDLSIVIPVYNCEDYLEFFLNSLLKQNIDNYEVIIIDDCSTDNSLNIIKHFCEEFENMLLYISGLKEQVDNVGVTESKLKTTLRSVIMAAANIVFVNNSLDILRESTDAVKLENK